MKGDLVMAAMNDKERLITTWVRQYQRPLFQRAYAVVKDVQLAEDTVQEVWIKAYKNIHLVQQIDNILAWLKTVTLRTAIDILRKEKRMREVLPSDDFPLENLEIYSFNDVDEAMEWKQTWISIQKCLSKSSSKLKQVFDLKFNLGLTDQEIASHLNISSSAVKTRVFRVRQIIKENFHEVDQGLIIQPGA